MRVLIVDAFTDRPFTGNPAGVCFLPGPAEAPWMQRVAAEMKHSETAFVRPLPGAESADFELRWFTPAAEVALCGHATLAAAHALYETAVVPVEQAIRFQTLHSGVLTVCRAGGNRLEMDFPAEPAAVISEPEWLTDGLGVIPLWVGLSTQNDLLVLLESEETVRDLVPDVNVLDRINVRGICVTAKGTGRYDFVSRFFAPRVGVPEDPVTGSAHCTLAPYWAKRTGRDELTGYQLSPRGGTVHAAVRGDRVALTGQAVTILDGSLSASTYPTTQRTT